MKKSDMTKVAGAAMLTLVLAACGGGEEQAQDAGSVSTAAADPTKAALKSTGLKSTIALPTVAPEPGVLVYESFGMADQLRPQGGKGDAREVTFRSISQFWVEWPGSKNMAWITGGTGQSWKFTGIGPAIDPAQLKTPLEPTDVAQGAASSGFYDPGSAVPAALLPLAEPATPYTVSASAIPISADPNAYVAVGLTSSGATGNNFASSGLAWVSLRMVGGTGQLIYQWRAGNATGPVVATGTAENMTYNRISLRVDPVARTVTALLNGVNLGTQPLSAKPSFMGFEGTGVVDNFEVRLTP